MGLMGRRASKPAADELPEWLRAFLLEGTKPERDTSAWTEYVTLYYLSGHDAMAKLWQQHGAALTTLTTEWVREHPGSRPDYWWRVEYQDDFDDGPFLDGKESKTSYRRRLEAHEAESQASCLRRRGLLLPGELERIPAEDFEPIEPEAA